MKDEIKLSGILTEIEEKIKRTFGGYKRYDRFWYQFYYEYTLVIWLYECEVKFSVEFSIDKETLLFDIESFEAHIEDFVNSDVNCIPKIYKICNEFANKINKEVVNAGEKPC